MDLSVRACERELLDLGVSEEDALESLADLRFVNRWLGNRGRFLDTVRSYLEGVRRPRLLDVGCGSADLPAALMDALRRPLLVVGVDIKLLHLIAAPPGIRRVVADVRALPFAPGAFDIVTASLFLHHFETSELPQVLRALYDLSTKVLVINDLRRAKVPYLFGKVMFPLLFRSRVSVTDGLISIRRAFTPDELAGAFAQAGIPARIRATAPYRLLAVAEKP